MFYFELNFIKMRYCFENVTSSYNYVTGFYNFWKCLNDKRY